MAWWIRVTLDSRFAVRSDDNWSHEYSLHTVIDPLVPGKNVPRYGIVRVCTYILATVLESPSASPWNVSGVRSKKGHLASAYFRDDRYYESLPSSLL